MCYIGVLGCIHMCTYTHTHTQVRVITAPLSLKHYITESFTLNVFMCARLFQPGQEPINQPPSQLARFASFTNWVQTDKRGTCYQCEGPALVGVFWIEWQGIPLCNAVSKRVTGQSGEATVVPILYSQPHVGRRAFKYNSKREFICIHAWTHTCIHESETLKLGPVCIFFPIRCMMPKF